MRRILGRLPHSGLFWLIVGPLAVAAVMVAVLHAVGMVGGDAAAHAYKIALVKRHQSLVWDNFWYGGSYGILAYGVVYYELAAWVGRPLLVVAATGLLPVLWHLYMRRRHAVAGFWPAIALTVVLALYIANGQDPFVFALALSMAGLVLLAYGRIVPAALAVALGAFTNPVATVVIAVWLVADFVAVPEIRRRYLWFALALAPFGIARVGLSLALNEKSFYLYQPGQALKYIAVGLGGAAVCWFSHGPARRSLATVFLVFGALGAAAWALPAGPLGNNAGRWLYVFAAPTILCVRRPRLPRLAMAVVVAGVAYMQLSTVGAYYLHPADSAAARAPFFAPALAYASQIGDPDYRIHVVALTKHGEARYFPLAGFAITRGWLRQADAIHDSLFYTRYTTVAYESWLADMGVQYVFVPKARLDFTSNREPALIAGSRDFQLVHEDLHWRVYRFLKAQPLIVAAGPGAATQAAGAAAQAGPAGPAAHVLSLTTAAIDLALPRAGPYLLRVSYSPYWHVQGPATAAPAVLSRAAGGFIALDVRVSGVYRLYIRCGLADLLGHVF
jgi:hypothetical protein